MKRKSFLVPTLSIILTIVLTTHPASSPAKPLVNTQPHWKTATIGSTFQININVTAVTDLYGWEFNITFDKTVLNVQTMDEGDFLLDFAYTIGYGTWPLGPFIDNTVGWVQMADSLFDYEHVPPQPPTDGADGNGVLAVVTFEVVGYGRSDLHFYYSALNTRDPVSGNPKTIDHDLSDGIFDNRIPGDITGPENPPGSGKYPCDGKVDTYDLAYLGKKFGTTDSVADFTGPETPPGSGTYPPDGTVNTYDLAALGKNFGKHT